MSLWNKSPQHSLNATHRSWLPHQPGWTQSTICLPRASRNVFNKKKEEEEEEANIHPALCMCNFHLQGKGYPKTSSHFSYFPGSAMRKESQSKFHILFPKVQVLEMPWPNQFQNWGFQVSIPKYHCFLKSKVSSKWKWWESISVIFIPDTGDSQTGLARGQGGRRACKLLRRTNRAESIYFLRSTVDEGRKDCVSASC